MDALTDTEIAALVVDELPDPFRDSRVVGSSIARLQVFNRSNPQRDLDGLHRIVDFHLTPLVLANPADVASRYIGILARNPDGSRAPLAMKLAALLVLAPQD